MYQIRPYVINCMKKDGCAPSSRINSAILFFVLLLICSVSCAFTCARVRRRMTKLGTEAKVNMQMEGGEGQWAGDSNIYTLPSPQPVMPLSLSLPNTSCGGDLNVRGEKE